MSDKFEAGVAGQELTRQSDRRASTRQESPREGAAGQDGTRQDTQAMLPRVDVIEDQTGITLLADIPGVAKDSLQIKVEADSLSIEGTISSATPQAMEATYAEVRIPRYRRSFALSRELDTERIEAQLENGVLRLRIPKQEKAQPKRISVTAG